MHNCLTIDSGTSYYTGEATQIIQIETKRFFTLNKMITRSPESEWGKKIPSLSKIVSKNDAIVLLQVSLQKSEN